MAIKLKPVEAYVIDLSEVKDIDRERLQVTFEDGSFLCFGIGTPYQSRGHLVLKHGEPVAIDTHHTRTLVKYFARIYWRRRMTFSVWQRFMNRLRELFDEHYRRPTKGWTYDRLKRELVVLLPLGSSHSPTGLRIGDHLYLQYGVPYRTLETDMVPFGKVVSIVAYKLFAQSTTVSVGNHA